ncbi:hypothetical protein M407DRAFT_246599 [Tulasnella calospora MUT 4182]|uniref:Uncharacterized protein n=1 Tax=Tulasnella calospora MUT 4182 TaxID=1051891 RepID=A0A0C3Q4X2_9AGAM|nr:hypothetical protein M407DRAFT_246599 [Tulasnella calospora MUT 4182]
MVLLQSQGVSSEARSYGRTEFPIWNPCCKKLRDWFRNASIGEKTGVKPGMRSRSSVYKDSYENLNA